MGSAANRALRREHLQRLRGAVDSWANNVEAPDDIARRAELLGGAYVPARRPPVAQSRYRDVIGHQNRGGRSAAIRWPRASFRDQLLIRPDSAASSLDIVHGLGGRAVEFTRRAIGTPLQRASPRARHGCCRTFMRRIMAPRVGFSARHAPHVLVVRATGVLPGRHAGGRASRAGPPDDALPTGRADGASRS